MKIRKRREDRSNDLKTEKESEFWKRLRAAQESRSDDTNLIGSEESGTQTGTEHATGLIRVLLVDPIDERRWGRRWDLEHAPDICVAGETGDVTTATHLAATLLPDVIVVAAEAMQPDSIRAVVTQNLRRSRRTALIILAPRVNDEEVFAALLIGAAAYTGEHVDSTVTHDLVRQVANGAWPIKDLLLQPTRFRSVDSLGIRPVRLPECMSEPAIPEPDVRHASSSRSSLKAAGLGKPQGFTRLTEMCHECIGCHDLVPSRSVGTQRTGH
jgi:DNA-binding NarL/FixJ family response regulator